MRSVLSQTRPNENPKLSPVGQYERYGFKTDPLAGEVVGGGSTSAIAHYKKTGQLPDPSLVWQAI